MYTYTYIYIYIYLVYIPLSLSIIFQHTTQAESRTQLSQSPRCLQPAEQEVNSPMHQKTKWQPLLHTL